MFTYSGMKMGVIYSLGTSVPQFGWTMVGIGMRFAVEIGLHRRKPEGYQPTVEDELKKRAFWSVSLTVESRH